MHEDNHDNTTDITDDEMSKLVSTEASRNKEVEYFVDKIAADDVFNGYKLYRVRRYGYQAKDDTAEPADHLSDQFIRAYCRRRNGQKRPHWN